MRALVVDDERLARVELKRLLTAHPEIEVVGEATNVDEAVLLVERLSPDLLFLDIQMPGGTGFDVLERLERVPLVVFTTAYDEHAVKAFEVNALDYLLKPIEPRRLRAALEKASGRTANAPSPPPGGYLERTFVRDRELCLLVELRDVTLFESEGNYTKLHLPDQQPLLNRSLSYLEERLDPKLFMRANRKELVTLAHVARIEPSGTGLLLHLRSGRHVEMSRRQAQRFRQIMSA
jgi:two-component system, LytTR family, response regulator